MKQLVIITLGLIAISCHHTNRNTMAYLEEIKQIEADFALMAANEGISKAFVHYAAEDAVLFRNNQLIKGKLAITEYFKQRQDDYKDMELTWSPDKVDVAESGDLAYTYGQYKLINKTTGQVSEGVFHTVWKRQSDGQWRFVWD